MITKEEYEVLPLYRKFTVIDALGEKHRASKEPSGTMFLYAPRAKSKGWRYMPDDFCGRFTAVIETPEEADAKWHKKVAKVIKRLETSGLWPELLEKYRNLYQMTLEDKNFISTQYWKLEPWKHGRTAEGRQKELEETFGTLIAKYPFVFPGNGTINTFYIWEQSEARTKSMYFGKWRNKAVKERIKNALETKTRFSADERASYDVSFEYDPEKNMAWYAEEYKDCGNGHYYIAIDGNTALFCEND